MWTLLLLLGLQFFFLFILHPENANAAWMSDDYAYRQKITFTHSADVTTDSRVTITVDTATLISAGKMQADCDDTRFTDVNGRPLRYQLTGTCNNASTTYDVVFSSVYNGTNIRYIYYGNPSAVSASDSTVANVPSLSPSGGTPTVGSEEKGPSAMLDWRFDEATGTTAYDSTSNRNDGSFSSGGAGTTTFEKQISIIDTGTSTSTSTFSPSDNSLGLVHWDSSMYTSPTVYFEVVMLNDGGAFPARATLYDSAGNAVSGSAITTTNTNYTRVRSSALTLTTGTDYTVRVACGSGTQCNDSGVFARFKSARLIIIQSSAAITATETQIEMGSIDSTFSTTATTLADPKYYQYDHDAYNSGTVNAYFEATLRASTINANSGGVSAGAGSTDTSVGTQTWSNASNITTSDIAYAFSLASGNFTSHYLTATNFGFSIPAGATILGIQAEFNNQYTTSGNDTCADNSIKIIKGGTITGTEQSIGTTWPSTYAYTPYGGSGSLWGTTWTVSDINNSNFGVAISGICTRAGGADTNEMFVEHVRMTVYYTVPSTATAILYNVTDGVAVTNSTISTTSGSYVLVRGASALSTNWDTTNDDTYEVRINTDSASAIAVIKSAKIIIQQTAGSPNIAKTESVIELNTFATQDTDSTYTSASYIYNVDKSNFSGGTWTANFTSTIKTSNVANAYFAQLYDGSSGIGQITANDTSYTYKASSDVWSSLPSSATDVDVQFKNGSTSTTRSSVSRLILKGTSLGGSGNPPTWKPDDACMFSKCLYFNGSDNSVYKTYSSDIELNPGTADFTIAGWFKHSSNAPAASTTDVLVARADGLNGVGYKVYMNPSGQMCFGIDGSAGSFPSDESCSAQSFADSTWHYITGVKTGTSSITVYVDGFQTGTPDASITGSDISGTSSAFRVGIDADGSSNAWDGYIDGVKYYNFAQSAIQIKTSFNNNSSESLSTPDMAYLNKGLVAYWNLDESATPSVDSSGNSNSGTWTNSPTSTTGKFYKAISLTSASSRYITVSDSSSLSPTRQVSLNAWINPSSSIASKSIVVKDTAYRMTTNGSSQLVCEIYSNGAWQTAATGTSTLVTSAWQMTSCTYNGQNVRAFVNGVLDASSNVSTSINDSSAALDIGRNGNTNYYNGSLDEVRVYNRALSDAEIRTLYDWAPAAVAYWNLDENTGTSANDKSGNSNTGTLTNNPKWTVGKFGYGVGFDGSDDVIDTGSGSTLDDLPNNGMTVDAWIYPNSLGESNIGRIITKASGTTPTSGWTLHLNNTTANSLEFQADYNTTDLSVRSAANTINTNTWNHVTLTWDGSTTATNVHMYINGAEAAYAVQTNGSGTYQTDASQNMYIGNESGGTATFNGTIDDVHVYNYVRSPKQVVSEMNAGHPAVGSPVGSPVGYWKFDEGTTNMCGTGSENDACDSSPNGNHLEMNTGSGAYTNNGKFGKAMDGNGTTRYATRGDDGDFDFALADPMSITTWAKSDSGTNPSAAEYVVNKKDGSAGYALYFNTSGNICFGLDDDGTSFPLVSTCSTTDYYDASWHSFIGVRDTSTDKIYIYVDSKLINSTTDTTTATLANGNALRIGDGGSGDDEFTGDIDETKIYRYALSATEVKVEYNRGSSQSMGSLSTNADGVTASNSAARAYCPPGNSETNCANGSDPSPVAEWFLDERTGTTANDTSGNANAGTLTNGPTWIAGQNSSAVSFDGSNDYITAGNGNSVKVTGNLTLEAWVYLSNISTNHMILTKEGGAGNRGYTLYVDTSGNVNMTISASGGVPITGTGTTVLSPNRWYHLTGVYIPSTSITIYVNGKKDGQNTSSIPASIFNSSANVEIGSANGGQAATIMAGRIDLPRIYNYARTAAQVAWDYNRGGPVGWWKFDECSGTTVYDASGNGNNGTLTVSSGGTYTSAGSCAGASSEAWKGGESGKFNSSIALDSTSTYDYADFGDMSALEDQGQISLSFWFNSSSRNTGGYLLSKTITTFANDQSWAIKFAAGSTSNIEAKIATTLTDTTTSGQTTSAPIASDNTWYHVVVVFDGTQTGNTNRLKIYINGVSQPLSFTGTIPATTVASSQNVKMNVASSLTLPAIVGKYDDVRLFNYALTAQQVKLLTNENAAVRFAPLTGTP